jgi:hypothetical protein
VLAPVLECLTELLFPLRWPNVFIPVLPAALVDFLEAFVPYLFGTTTAVLDRFLDEGAVPDKAHHLIHLPLHCTRHPHSL